LVGEKPPSPAPNKGGPAEAADGKLATPGGISGGKPDKPGNGGADGADSRPEAGGDRSEAGGHRADSRAGSIIGGLIERGAADGAGFRGQTKRPQGANAREAQPDKPGARHGLFGAPNAAQGGAWALVNLLIAILCSVLTAATAIRLARSRDDETGCETDEKRRAVLRRLGMLAGVSAPIAFLLTENMNDPMVAVDRWTLLMSAIFAVQAVLMAAAGMRAEEARNKEA
jgi:hypothetical protein